MTVDDSEVPILTNTEQVDEYFPGGSGATPILVVGKTPVIKDCSKIYTFHSYADAVATSDNGGIGPEAEGNELLSAIKEIFSEGSVDDQDTDELGVDTVYAINVGSTPTVEDWTSAQTASEVLEEKELIEIYLGCTDIAFITTTETHLLNLDEACLYRLSFFANTATTPTDAIKTTDYTQTTFVRDSRIYIHYDPTKQVDLAVKVAYTPYYQDPCKDSYRTVTADDILPLSFPNKNTLIKNGIVCDMPSNTYINGVRMAKPVKVVSTAYSVGADGKRPADANAHQRRNADYTWTQCDEIAKSELDNNNTPAGLKFIKEEVQAFLDGQENLGYLSSPECSVGEVTNDLEAIKLYKGAQFVSSIYRIEQTSRVKALAN